MRAASAALSLPMSALRRAKSQGCPAFRSNRVHVAELREWLTAHPLPTADTGDLRDQKLAQEVRRLRMANDEKEVRLVARSWVIERFQLAGGELNTHRMKSEAEHPLLFSAACPGADVAACRSIVRKIWHEVFAMMEGMGKHFEETA